MKKITKTIAVIAIIMLILCSCGSDPAKDLMAGMKWGDSSLTCLEKIEKNGLGIIDFCGATWKREFCCSSDSGLYEVNLTTIYDEEMITELCTYFDRAYGDGLGNYDSYSGCHWYSKDLFINFGRSVLDWDSMHLVITQK